MIDYGYTTATTGPASWDNPPGDIVANLKKMMDTFKAIQGRDPGPDVFVILREQMPAVRAMIGEEFTGGFWFGIPLRIVDTVEEGRHLAIALTMIGKRVGLVGKLNASPAADIARMRAGVWDEGADTPAIVEGNK